MFYEHLTLTTKLVALKHGSHRVLENTLKVNNNLIKIIHIM